MKRHSAWLAAGFLVFVVLACNLSKRSANVSTNTTNDNSAATETEATSSTVIKEIHMAKDDGSGDPGNETQTFNPGDRTIHCVVKLAEAKSGTKMRFSWWIVDADGTTNQKVKDIDYTTRALENIVHAHLTLPQDWPAGRYKVEVYVNGNRERTIGYTVS